MTGRHFSRDTKVCVGDIDVSGPPVWRVSAKYKNATSGIEKHSEIEVAEAHPLASAAIRHCDWAQPCHLCGETGRILRRSAPGFGSPCLISAASERRRQSLVSASDQSEVSAAGVQWNVWGQQQTTTIDGNDSDRQCYVHPDRQRCSEWHCGCDCRSDLEQAACKQHRAHQDRECGQPWEPDVSVHVTAIHTQRTFLGRGIPPLGSCAPPCGRAWAPTSSHACRCNRSSSEKSSIRILPMMVQTSLF